MVRVAVLQIESASPEREIESCLAQIDRCARDHAVRIVVCPELALPDSDADEDELARMLTLRMQFSERARSHGAFVGLSLRGTTHTLRTWLSPDGAASHEPAAGDASGTVTISSEYGVLGLVGGNDALGSRAVRRVVGAGANMVAIALRTGPAAHSALHAPARAVESGVHVLVASTFECAERGEQAEEALPEPTAAPKARGTVSQILEPSGSPLAIAALEQMGLALAEVDLTSEVHLPDGTPHAALRRPELGRGARPSREGRPGGGSIAVVALAPELARPAGEIVEDTIRQIAEVAADVDLIVLPELFCFELQDEEEAEAAAAQFGATCRALAESLRGLRAHVVTSLVERRDRGLQHVGVVLGQAGVVARQPALHVTQRHGWAVPGSRYGTVRLPWGSLALTVGEDSLVPELLHGYRLLGANVIAAPLSARYHHAATLVLPALADEFGLGVVAAFRPDGEPERTRGSSFIVDPSAWPANRALPGQSCLRASLRVGRQTEASVRTEVLSAL